MGISERAGNIVGKGENAPCQLIFFQRLPSQGCENSGLFGKGNLVSMGPEFRSCSN